MSFAEYMDSILAKWRIIFSEDETKVLSRTYVGIYRFEQHIESMKKNGTVPTNFISSAEKELEYQLEAFKRMVYSCVSRDYVDENVPRETL